MEDQKKSELKENLLLEIYKIQTQVAENISDRQKTTSRYYITTLFILIAGLFTLLQIVNAFPISDNSIGKSIGRILFGFALAIYGLLGGVLSWTWLDSITNYARMRLKKQIMLIKLEKALELQFTEPDNELATELKLDRTIPIILIIVFAMVFGSGLGFIIGNLTS